MAERQRRFGLWLNLAICWAVTGFAALALWYYEVESGWHSVLGVIVVALAGITAGVLIFVRHSRREPDWEVLVEAIERHYPQLEGRLATAMQQKRGSNGRLDYLQEMVMAQALEAGRKHDWAEVIPSSRLRMAQAAHWAGAVLLVVAVVGLARVGGPTLLTKVAGAGVTVSPGDTAIERGNSLVVLARFKGRLPSEVTLAFGQAGSLQRVPLIKTLGDPLFGGSIQEVSTNFVYRIEYGGQQTRDFKVTVYEHPRLERSDVDLSFPDYTALPHKRIENTRRLSAVEGSRVDLALLFNKPVTSAKLVARGKEHTTVPLVVNPAEPKASLNQFQLDASKTFDLQLVDAEGRTNKVPAEFVFEALKNRPPEMRLSAPRGDIRPSPLEEITFDGTVWDDFGVKSFGLAYGLDGQAPKFIELGRDVAGNQKQPFHHVLRLEDLGIKSDQLISWFVWADDLGPDGRVRRTMGDLYFGEVRPFEEVFREGQGMEGQSGQSGGEDRTGKLADLEKQIVNATWKLQREHSTSPQSGANPPSSSWTSPRDDRRRGSATLDRIPAALRDVISSTHVMGRMDASSASDPSTSPGSAADKGPSKGSYVEDASVVKDSQAQALEQAKEALQGQRDPQAAALWQKAVSEMESALARLQRATNSPAELKEALAAEQSAYQALIRLQAHEYQVSRSRSRSQSGSSRNQQLQQQLQEMDLSQSENKYENQREAQRNQNPERREQLQIMSRLQELARRQQDLNERLKELQTALQEARTDQEREEIKRQLKRLEEQEQQMLADVDELRQRMDRPENQSRLADERKQLDQTRQEVQKAADAASQGAASQALAAGTRAQDQLQQLREDIRKKNSSQFADDLRQMRGQARELERQQEDILKKIRENNSSEQKSLASGDNQEEIQAQLARQKQLMTNLLDKATQISQQAEEAEPLASKQLYDTVRKFTQDTAKDLKETENELLSKGPMTRSLFDMLKGNSEQGGQKLEELTSEMLRLGYPSQAGQIGEKARTGIDNLRKGVERAAESVLGDDTEDLRLAQKQLDDLAGQLQREIADNQGSQTNGASQAGAQGRDPSRASRGQSKEQANDPSSAQSGSQQAQNSGSSQQQQQDSTGNQAGQSSSQAAQATGQGQGGQQPSQQAGEQPGEAGRGTPTPRSGQMANQGRGTQPGTQRQPRENAAGGEAGGGGDPVETASAIGAGGGVRNLNWERLMDESARRQSAPITGEDFASWSDRLREVEQLVDAPDLRDDLAKARERARLARQDFKRERKKPDWAVLQLQVMKPLTEVRDRITDELNRRESREALVPLDRDPVPNRYSDLVRRYYEELGKDKRTSR